MTIGEFKEIIKDVDDNVELCIRHKSLIGDVIEVSSAEVTTYGFFGKELPCVILDKEEEYIW